MLPSTLALTHSIDVVSNLSIKHAFKMKSMISILYAIYGAVGNPFPIGDWEKICTLSYYHHHIRNMNH